MSHNFNSAIDATSSILSGTGLPLANPNRPARRMSEVSANKAMVDVMAQKQAVMNVLGPVASRAQDVVRSTLKTCVLYNSFNADSVFAAAMYMDATAADNMTSCVGYTDKIPYETLRGYRQVVCIGVPELSDSFMDHVRKNKIQLVIFAHAGTHEDAIRPDIPARRNWYLKTIPGVRFDDSDHIKVIYKGSNDESYGKLFDSLKGTMTFMVRDWLLQNGLTVVAPSLKKLYVPLMHMATMNFPSSYANSSGAVQGKAKVSASIEAIVQAKAEIFSLMPRIIAALKNHHPAHALRNMDTSVDMDAYASHWGDCVETYNRSAVSAKYVVKTAKGAGIIKDAIKGTFAAVAASNKRKQTMQVMTMACGERQWLDMLAVSLMHNKSLITYEDMHGSRLWRVYAKDTNAMYAIASSLGGEQMWFDGLSVRTYAKQQ